MDMKAPKEALRADTVAVDTGAIQPDQKPRPRHRETLSYWQFMEDMGPLTRGLLLVLMGATLFFTFRGAEMVLTSDGGGLMDRASAAVFAVGVAAMVYLFWRFAMGIVPRIASPVFWGLSVAVLVAGAAMIVGISSILNVVALGGAEAQKLELHRTIARFERSLDDVVARATATATIRTNLQGGARELQGWAEREAADGAVSGYSGRGAVHTALNAAAGQIEGLAAMTAETMDTVSEKALSARRHVADMRAAAEDQAPLPERLAAFSASADSLRGVMLEIVAMDPAGALSRDLSRLAGSGATGAPSAGSRSIAAAQSRGLARVAEIRAEIVGPLAEAAKAIAARPAPAIPQHERISMVRAVIGNGWALLPYWVAGIGLDLMPLLLILFLSILYRVSEGGASGNDEDAAEGSAASTTTVQEILRAKEALSIITRPPDQKQPVKTRSRQIKN